MNFPVPPCVFEGPVERMARVAGDLATQIADQAEPKDECAGLYRDLCDLAAHLLSIPLEAACQEHPDLLPLAIARFRHAFREIVAREKLPTALLAVIGESPTPA